MQDPSATHGVAAPTVLLSALLFAVCCRAPAGTGADAKISRDATVEPDTLLTSGAYLETIGSVRVLHLFGSHRQRGFDYGYLLAGEAIDLFQRYVLDYALAGASEYSTVRKLMQNNAEWPPDALATRHVRNFPDRD